MGVVSLHETNAREQLAYVLEINIALASHGE
jgi:hypothetical protein